MLWADGVELSKFFADLETTTPLEPSLLDKPSLGAATDSVLGGIARSLDAHNRQRWRAERLVEVLRRDLVAARLSCIGRRFHDGRYRLEHMDSDFWLGAQIHPTISEAENNDVKFNMIHVVAQRTEPYADEAPLSLTKRDEPPPEKGAGRDEPDTLTKPTVTKRTKPATYPTFRAKVLELRSNPDFMGLALREDQARYARAEILGQGFKKKDDTPGYKTGTLVKWLGEILGDDTPE